MVSLNKYMLDNSWNPKVMEVDASDDFPFQCSVDFFS